MVHIYVLIQCDRIDEETDEVIGVFSTHQLARAARDSVAASSRTHHVDGYRIDAFVLDKEIK